jgi:hypothetical protein
MNPENGRKSSVNPRRHEASCKVCSHPQKDDVERDFVNWNSPDVIAKEYGLTNRASVYRHAHATGLFAKRTRNIRAALEKIIEKAGEVQVNASAVVSAVTAYSRINAAGQMVDRAGRQDLQDMFERMSEAELEEYASSGKLPDWCKDLVGSKFSSDVEEHGND